MKHLKHLFFIPVLILIMLGYPQPGAVAQAPVVIISDGTFNAGDWSIFKVESVAGTSHTVQQELTGGNPDAFRSMTHTLPPVAPGDLAEIKVTHLYLGASYDPGVQGAIDHINYAEDGILLNLPYIDAHSVTHVALVQDNRLFLSKNFFRFIGNFNVWQSETLTDLTANDFAADDGSGDQPDFSASGGVIQFGYGRSNTRTETLPPVPLNQDLVYEHGLDNWTVTVYSAGAPPGQSADLEVTIRCDPCVGESYLRSDASTSPPVNYTVTVSNLGPNAATGVTVEVESRSSILMTVDSRCLPISSGSRACNLGTLDNGENVSISFQATDHFPEPISDGTLWGSQEVIAYVSGSENDPQVFNNDDAIAVYFFDCTLDPCLLVQYFYCGINPPIVQQPFLPLLRSGAQFLPDLITYYRLRDEVMAPTPDGRRYTDLYYTYDPEIQAIVLMDPTLLVQGLDTLALWEPNLQALVDGDSTATITQAQVDAIKSFLTNLSAASSPELQQLIADELARLGPLDGYVGMKMREAKSKAIGDPTVFLPFVVNDHH